MVLAKIYQYIFIYLFIQYINLYCFNLQKSYCVAIAFNDKYIPDFVDILLELRTLIGRCHPVAPVQGGSPHGAPSSCLRRPY